MDFALNAEQQMLHASATRFFAARHPLARARQALPWSDPAQQQLWQGMAAMGWMDLLRPEAQGGLGLGLTEACLVAEAAGSQLLNLPWAASAVLLPLWLQAAADDAPALRELARSVAAGERAVHCVAEHDRIWDHAGQCSDMLVVRGLEDPGQPLQLTMLCGAPAAMQPGLDPTLLQAAAVALPPATPWHTLAMPAEARAHARAAWRLMHCAELIGLAQAALALASGHAIERVQFGRPIGSYQAVKHQLANAWMAVDNARLAALYAGAALDGRLPDARFACAAAEFTAIEGALQATRTAIQVCGGMGFTWEHAAHLYLKRAQLLAARLGGASRALSRLEELAPA